MSDSGDYPRKVGGGTCDESKDGSATTTGTSQSVGVGNQDTTRTVESLPHGDQNTRRRLTTHHRKTLERIKTDSFQNTRHRVPDKKHNHKKRQSYPQRAISDMQETYANRSCSEWLEVFLPMAKWIKIYQWKTDLLKDVIAGCTVGIMVIPQSMSYAKLAGLPVEYGLYSALVPVYAYSFFGSSRQLAVGPVALISLLLSTGLVHVLEKTGHTKDNTPNYQEIYNTLAIQTTFLVGVCYIVLGLLRYVINHFRLVNKDHPTNY